MECQAENFKKEFKKEMNSLKNDTMSRMDELARRLSAAEKKIQGFNCQ